MRAFIYTGCAVRAEFITEHPKADGICWQKFAKKVGDAYEIAGSFQDVKKFASNTGESFSDVKKLPCKLQ